MTPLQVDFYSDVNNGKQERDEHRAANNDDQVPPTVSNKRKAMAWQVHVDVSRLGNGPKFCPVLRLGLRTKSVCITLPGS